MTAANQIVLVSDPAVAAVDVRDCGERLVAVADGPYLRVDGRLADPDGHFRLVRAGVAERLSRAAQALPAGVALGLVEGYRPAHLQARYFADYRAALARSNRGLGPQALRDLAARAVAPPGPAAPHISGGAIDVTLYGADGQELDMGSAINATPEVSRGACYSDAENLPPQARQHRSWLTDALRSAGFVNYPTEWWHWSFGDRYWALRTGADHALYDAAEPNC